MNDLTDRLAAAAEAAPDQLGLPLAEVRRRGSRRRQVRTSATAAAAIVAVAAGTVGVVQLVPSRTVVVGGPAAPASPTSAPPSPPASPAPDSGEVKADPDRPIETSADLGGGTAAFWFVQRNDELILVVARHRTDGRYEMIGVTNDTGDVRAAGFHAGWEVAFGDKRLLVGYLAGPDVTSVKLTVEGTPVTATVAPWTGDRTLRVWWCLVPAPAAQAQLTVTDLRALSATGAVVAQAPGNPIAVG